jgi:hypothetical protein
MGVAVAGLHVLFADVLRALVPVVVSVVALSWHKALEQSREVLQETVFELGYPDATGRMWRVDAGDTVLDTALADALDYFIRDVDDRQAAARPQLSLV